jgi:hypothetical protein
MVIDGMKGPVADDVAVVIDPTPDEGVGFGNELVSGEMMRLSDDRFEFGQEGFDPTFGRFDEKFSLVGAHILAQEIEAGLERGQSGFFWGQAQTALGQESFQAGFDLRFQERFAATGYDMEVVGEPNEMNFLLPPD